MHFLRLIDRQTDRHTDKNKYPMLVWVSTVHHHIMFLEIKHSQYINVLLHNVQRTKYKYSPSQH